MILGTQTNYAFTCSICNTKFYVYNDNDNSNKPCRLVRKCENFINLSIEEIPYQLKNLFSNPCDFLIFMYTIKRKFSKETFIDPFEFTYCYIKELSKISGFKMTLDYSSFYDPNEEDHSIFQEFLVHFARINQIT